MRSFLHYRIPFAIVNRSFPRNTCFRLFFKLIFFIFLLTGTLYWPSLQLQILKGEGVYVLSWWSPFSYCTVASEVFTRWLLRKNRMEGEKGRCWEKKEPEIWVCVGNHWGFVLQANVLSQLLITPRSKGASMKAVCWRKREVKGEIMFLFITCFCLLKKMVYFQTTAHESSVRSCLY